MKVKIRKEEFVKALKEIGWYPFGAFKFTANFIELDAEPVEGEVQPCTHSQHPSGAMFCLRRGGCTYLFAHTPKSECKERGQHCWNKGTGHTCKACCWCGAFVSAPKSECRLCTHPKDDVGDCAHDCHVAPKTGECCGEHDANLKTCPHEHDTRECFPYNCVCNCLPCHQREEKDTENWERDEFFLNFPQDKTGEKVPNYLLMRTDPGYVKIATPEDLWDYIKENFVPKSLADHPKKIERLESDVTAEALTPDLIRILGDTHNKLNELIEDRNKGKC